MSLVSTGTLGTWDRAAVPLERRPGRRGGGRSCVGPRLRLGRRALAVGAPIPRCVMVTRPQPGGIGRDTGVLKTIHRERGGELAVGAQVLEPGTVRTGDLLEPA